MPKGLLSKHKALKLISPHIKVGLIYLNQKDIKHYIPLIRKNYIKYSIGYEIKSYLLAGVESFTWKQSVVSSVQCKVMYYLSSPQSVMTIFLSVPPSCKPYDSITLTVSMPSFTWPNTTCLPSSLRKNEREHKAHTMMC